MPFTIAQLKKFLIAHYKHQRLYGRTERNGWHDKYGDNIVRSHARSLAKGSKSYIGRHESNDGQSRVFTAEDVIGFKGATS